MNAVSEPGAGPLAPDRVEGYAQVVAVFGDRALLEPEQTTSCGSCASGGACGVKGVGTLAARLEARRFTVVQPGLAVGDRVVVGVRPSALVTGALTAYALPLATLIAGAIGGQSSGLGDGATLLAALGGLAIGIAGAWLLARRQHTRGELSPQYLRHAAWGGTCHVD